MRIQTERKVGKILKQLTCIKIEIITLQMALIIGQGKKADIREIVRFIFEPQKPFVLFPLLTPSTMTTRH